MRGGIGESEKRARRWEMEGGEEGMAVKGWKAMVAVWKVCWKW